MAKTTPTIAAAAVATGTGLASGRIFLFIQVKVALWSVARLWINGSKTEGHLATPDGPLGARSSRAETRATRQRQAENSTSMADGDFNAELEFFDSQSFPPPPPPSQLRRGRGRLTLEWTSIRLFGPKSASESASQSAAVSEPASDKLAER